MSATVKMPKVIDRVLEARAEAASLTVRVMATMSRLTEEAERSPDDWTLAGDAGRIVETLRQLQTILDPAARCEVCGDPCALESRLCAECEERAALEGHDEPIEGDWVTEDHRHFFEHGTGKPLLTLSEAEASDPAATRELVWTEMKRQQYWPNAWLADDHGGFTLIAFTQDDKA